MNSNLPFHAVSRPRYTPLERLTVPRPVDRIEYIAHVCARCRVLDLGAMDETACAAKRGSGTWLHEEIARRALRVDGIDSLLVNRAVTPPQFDTSQRVTVT